MKGPYERLKYDLRRVWQCPVCRRRERTSGAVTFRYCSCRTKLPYGQPVLMKLVADGVRRVGPPAPHLRSSSAPPAEQERSPTVSAQPDVSGGPITSGGSAAS